MAKLSVLLLSILLIVSCKNPFSKDSTEESPQDFSIQNTENGKILLRLKPVPGEKTKMQMNLSLKPKGTYLSLDTNFIADLNMLVASNSDSTTDYHVDFQRIRFNTSLMGADIKYDSQSADSNLPPQFKDQIESILAKKVVMQMDTLSHVKSIQFGGNEESFSKQAIDLNTLFIPLPEKPVGVGDSWQENQEVQGVDNQDLTYTIEKISNTDVLVKVNSSQNANNSAEIQGQYLIDRKTGFTKQGSLSILGNQDGKSTIQIKMTLKSEIAGS